MVVALVLLFLLGSTLGVPTTSQPLPEVDDVVFTEEPTTAIPLEDLESFILEEMEMPAETELEDLAPTELDDKKVPVETELEDVSLPEEISMEVFDVNPLADVGIEEEPVEEVAELSPTPFAVETLPNEELVTSIPDPVTIEKEPFLNSSYTDLSQGSVSDDESIPVNIETSKATEFDVGSQDGRHLYEPLEVAPFDEPDEGVSVTDLVSLEDLEHLNADSDFIPAELSDVSALPPSNVKAREVVSYEGYASEDPAALTRNFPDIPEVYLPPPPPAGYDVPEVPEEILPQPPANGYSPPVVPEIPLIPEVPEEFLPPPSTSYSVPTLPEVSEVSVPEEPVVEVACCQEECALLPVKVPREVVVKVCSFFQCRSAYVRPVSKSVGRVRYLRSKSVLKTKRSLKSKGSQRRGWSSTCQRCHYEKRFAVAVTEVKECKNVCRVC